MIVSYSLQISNFIQTQLFFEARRDDRWHDSMTQEGTIGGGEVSAVLLVAPHRGAVGSCACSCYCR